MFGTSFSVIRHIDSSLNKTRKGASEGSVFYPRFRYPITTYPKT